MLPARLEDLRGLRAARWIRESTRGQYDTYGPEAQREQQDRAVERWQLVDTGIEWQVAHSGRTIGSTRQFREMVGRAGIDYDILLVGYVSRFARDLRTAVNARYELHLAGAAILFCDERVLSSDEDEWEEWARESVEAEAYSRRLAKRISEGYAAKFRRFRDPGGQAPLGFRRTVERPRTLEVDDRTIVTALALFERYASGAVSIDQLAREFTMVDRSVDDILKNPIYNGWVLRKGERVAAPWRLDPPVSDHLWNQVQSIMARRSHGGGPRLEARIDPLRGLIQCTCGSPYRAHGLVRSKHRRLHVAPECSSGVKKRMWETNTWLPWLYAQIAGIRVDDALAAEVLAALSSPRDQPVSIDVGRFERARRQLANDVAANRLNERDFLGAMERLREEEHLATVRRPVGVYDPGAALAKIRGFKQTWDTAPEPARAAMLQAVYDEVVVEGEEFAYVTLTPDAYACGMALALPEQVGMALARPTGFDFPDPIPTEKRIPVKVADAGRASG